MPGISPNKSPMYISLPEVARRLGPGRGGKLTHVNTIAGWIINGVRLRAGGRLRLAALRAPGRWLVEPGELTQFLDMLARDKVGAEAEAELTASAS